MLNLFRDLPTNRLHSRPDENLGLGDDVAASIRETLSYNLKRILADLKAETGILQQEVAKRMDMSPSHFSAWVGRGVPTRLDEFISVVNRFYGDDKRIKPEDLFRDREAVERATKDLVLELAKRAGYELKRN